MSALYPWAAGLCAAAILVGAVSLLAPKGNVRRMLRPILVLFVLSALVLPLLQVPFSSLFSAFSPESPNAAALEGELLLELREAAQTNLKNLAEKILIEKGIEYRRIEVVTDIGADGCIEIKQIRLFSGELQSAMLGQSVLTEVLGIQTEVLYEGEAARLS